MTYIKKTSDINHLTRQINLKTSINHGLIVEYKTGRIMRNNICRKNFSAGSGTKSFFIKRIQKK